jgi:urease accessory protein
MTPIMTRISIASALLIFAAAPAMAHLDPAEHGSFAAGATHPLTGLDHILAMVAVGLWSAMMGGRALWLVPSAFVVAMGAGFAAALGGLPVPLVEPAILASVVVLGLLVAAAVRLPTLIGMAVVGVFAVFHGAAHGVEIGGASSVGYGAGFTLSTALLHAIGIAIGLLVGSRLMLGRSVSRLLGAGTAVAGLGLAAGLV